MAMTKAEQDAAAERIRKKMGSMTEEERRVYEHLVRRPEEYLPPDPETGERTCGVCGEKFRDIKDRETALEQFSEHMRKHNATPAQWTEAHQKIRDGNERYKKENAV